MPTRSDPTLPGQWAARSTTTQRSVFGNYTPATDAESQVAVAGSCQESQPATSSDALQPAIDRAVARSFIYRFIAKAYEDPTRESWDWLTAASTLAALRATAGCLTSGSHPSLEALVGVLIPEAADAFFNAYLSAFGHAARGPQPMNEIEYGDLKADPLFQPHRLADLAAFYRAFGLEVAPDAGERHDHLCLELEFMCVLAGKEAFALEHQLDADQLQLCRDAQKKFLREHLGRWTIAFTRRLAVSTADPVLRSLAEFTRLFVEAECARVQVQAGSEELALRPVDEAGGRMCDSCGITNLLPGVEGADRSC